jgi:hypothetical protein
VWAYGQLETLRCVCLSLARLQHDPADTAIGPEAYFKVEQVLSAEQLSLFTASLCPLEAPAMLIAARVIGRLYGELAPGLAAAHGLAYPRALERLMLARLEESTAFDRSGSSAASA